MLKISTDCILFEQFFRSGRSTRNVVYYNITSLYKLKLFTVGIQCNVIIITYAVYDLYFTIYIILAVCS